MFDLRHRLRAELGGPVNAALRPVHYLGNKSRYLAPIVTAVESIALKGTAVVDLFAGTGVVTRALADRRPVLSADVQTYSAVLSKALCAPVTYSDEARRKILSCATAWIDALSPAITRLLDYESFAMRTAEDDPTNFILLTEEGSLSHLAATDFELSAAKSAAAPELAVVGATLTSYYGGVYFSYRQALELDAIMAAIGHSVRSPAEATLVAALLGVASDTVATVGGHFAQPMRLRTRTGDPKTQAVARALRSRNASALSSYDEWLQRYKALRPTTFPCSTLTSDYRDVLDSLDNDVAAIYADPPYTRDHYSRFYHVLETIALGDDPGVASAPGSELPSRGLYRLVRHQSPFSIRSQAGAAFDHLFASASERCIPVVLSYSPQGGGTQARPETRLMTIDEITARASLRYSHVEVRPIDSSAHSRFNRVDLHGTTPEAAEVIIIARP